MMTLDSDAGVPERLPDEHPISYPAGFEWLGDRNEALGIGASTIPVNPFVVDRTPDERPIDYPDGHDHRSQRIPNTPEWNAWWESTRTPREIGGGRERNDLIPFESDADPYGDGLADGYAQGLVAGRREMTTAIKVARSAAYHAGLEDGRAEEHRSPWLEITIAAGIVVVAILAFIALVSQ